MNRLHDLLKLILILAGVALCTMGTVFFYRGSQMLVAVRQTVSDSGQLVQNARLTVDGVNKSLFTPDGKDPRKRTAIQEILDNSAGISRMSYEYWKTFPGKAEGTLTSINTLIAGIGSRADQVLDNLVALTGRDGEVQGVLIAFRTDLETLNGTLAQTTQTIKDLDANLINDPEIKEILKQLAGILTHTDAIAGHVEKMSADVEDKFHHYLYDKPSLKSRIMVALTMAYKVALIKATAGF